MNKNESNLDDKKFQTIYINIDDSGETCKY